MNNPALREEMTSPAHKAIMHFRQRDDGKGEEEGKSPTYNNGDLDLTNNIQGTREISPTERQIERIVREVQYPDDSTVIKTPIPNERQPFQNMINLDMTKVSKDSKPMDESAKREYSPVIPNGITSNRYEEMKTSGQQAQIRTTEERELD